MNTFMANILSKKKIFCIHYCESKLNFFFAILKEGACIITGISYNGKKDDHTYDWSGVNNVKLLDFELSISLQVTDMPYSI